MRILMGSVAVLLMSQSIAACAPMTKETPSSFSYKGKTYPAVTREYTRRNGSTYSRRVVKYGSRSVSCSATDDLDCVAELRNSRGRNDR